VCVCVCVCVCVWWWWGGEGGVDESCLACTVLSRWGGLLRELGPLFDPGDGRVNVVQAVGHLLTDDVDESLEGLLHVDVVLGTGLEELKPCRRNTASSLAPYT